MSRFNSVEPGSEVRLGVALAAGGTTIGTGVNGGAVAAIVGMLVGPVPGKEVGAAVGARRVGVAVALAAMDRIAGATRVKLNNPQASRPETIATDIKIIDERGACERLIGHPVRERAIGANSGCTSEPGPTSGSPVAVAGAGGSSAGTGRLGIAVGRSSLSGGGKVSGGDEGGSVARSLPLGSTGYFGLGEGGARGNRRRRRVKGSCGVRVAGSGMEGGWCEISDCPGFAGDTPFVGAGSDAE